MPRLLVCTLLVVFALTACNDGDDSAEVSASGNDPADDCFRRELRKKRSVLAERPADCSGNDIRKVVLRGGQTLTLEVEFAGDGQLGRDIVVRGAFAVQGRDGREADDEGKPRRRRWRLTFRCDERAHPRFDVLFGHGPVQRLDVRSGTCRRDDARLVLDLDRQLFAMKGTTAARPTAVDLVAWTRLDDGPYTRVLDRLDEPVEVPEALQTSPTSTTSTQAR